MKVGLLANTHDRLPAIRGLLRKLAAEGVSLTLHAGDFVAPWSLRPYAEAGMAVLGVFGHNDGDRDGLMAEAQRHVGVELYESPHVLDLGGRKVVLVHDLRDLSARAREEYGVVVHGTNHQSEVREEQGLLVINPGEACGWLTGTPTCAVLDLDTLTVSFLTLAPGELA
jgi:putative phosphoesterase